MGTSLTNEATVATPICQVKSRHAKSSQVKSSQVKSSQVKSYLVMNVGTRAIRSNKPFGKLVTFGEHESHMSF